MLYLIKKIKSSYFLAGILTFLFILAGSIVSLGRYWQYETFYYDFGIFDRAIWQVAHFRSPIIDHFVLGEKLIFADHFHPSVFLLSPLYWLTDKQEIILIAQAAAAGLSGIVIYLIGIKIFKDKLASLSLLVCYFLFIGLQNAVITDFHEITVAALPLSLTFWAIISKKLKLFVIFGLITLGFKEINFFLGIALGIFIIFFNRKWLKAGLITSVFSLVYGILAIKIVIPHFSGVSYIYTHETISQPLRFVTILLDNPTKIQTLLKTFWSFSFLPFFAPLFWILIAQDFLVRFFGGRIEITSHYSAIIAVIMAVSSIFALKLIGSKLNKTAFKFLLILIVLNSVFLYRFVYHGPFALAYNRDFYRHNSEFEFLNKMVRLVPKNASVMAQNNIAPHFTHYKNVFLLRMNYEKFGPDYIVVDAREGQNINDFFNTKEFGLEKFLDKVSNDKNYVSVYKTKEQFIFRRLSP